MRYKVITTLQKNGEAIQPGDFIEVSGIEADALLKNGTIEAAHKPFSGYKPRNDVAAAGKGE